MSRKTKAWFLLQFKPNTHRIAESNLNRQGFETFLPLQKITRRKRDHFSTKLKPLFPGYMFVTFNPNGAHWRTINSTIGVSKIVSLDSQPNPVPPNLINELMAQCNSAKEFVPSKTFIKGNAVRLLNGPFTNFIATIEKIDSKKRIWILMDFMGQKTRFSTKPNDLIIKN